MLALPLGFFIGINSAKLAKEGVVLPKQARTSK